MVAFFRQIRRALVESASARRYLIYAIGEVVLVMIGILLALQVNNWNEEKKAKEKERRILLEIVNSIDQDLMLYDDAFQWRLDMKRTSIDSLLAFIGKKEPIPIQTLMRLYNRSKMDPVFRFDNGPFEALKSQGLDIIRVDSLRSLINLTYQVRMPATKKFVDLTQQLNDPQIIALESKIMNRTVKEREDGKWRPELIPAVENIASHKFFVEILDLELEKSQEYDRRLSHMRRRLQRVKDNILVVLHDYE